MLTPSPVPLFPRSSLALLPSGPWPLRHKPLNGLMLGGHPPSHAAPPDHHPISIKHVCCCLLWSFSFFFFLFVYLSLAVLGLRLCARAFSSCGKWGPLFIVVRRPLTVAASLVAEHRLQTRRFSSCGSRAQLLRGMWDLPRPGLEPVSPALAGSLSTTAPPGKPWSFSLISPQIP